MFDDHYQALWVPRDASDDEIKKAYYALARDCHPDLHPNDEAAKRKFQRVQRAFEVLGDPARREKYNRDYDAKFRRIPTPPPPPPPVQTPRESQDVDASVMPNSKAASSPGARTRTMPSGVKSDRMAKRPGSRGSPALAVMRIIVGGLVGLVFGWLTFAMFFPNVLWKERAYREPPSQQEPSRPNNRRSQTEPTRQTGDESRHNPGQNKPGDSAAPPGPANKLPASPGPPVPQAAPQTPQPQEDKKSTIPGAPGVEPQSPPVPTAPIEGLEKRTAPEKPSSLVAPFDAETAKAKQKEWASYLGRGISVENSLGMQLVLIPPGEFMMGSPVSELAPSAIQTLHHATIAKPYLIGATEVTQGQWQAVMGNNPSHFKGTSLPVELVSWNDALEFCRQLSEREGKRYRLPTEAEWEYACRAGTTTEYSFGDSAAAIGSYAWLEENSGRQTHPVGQKLPNAWGLHDMHGNVHEWCSDEYSETLPAGKDPKVPSGSLQVGRSSCWHDAAVRCRTVMRGELSPTYQNSDLGFRVILVLSDTAKGTVAESTNSELGSSAPLKKTKSPVPHAEQQAAAMKLAGEVFHLETDKTAAEKRKLAADLLRAASESSRDVNECYALLTIAADLAADSGDAQIWVASIDQMAASFEIDSLAIKKSKIMKAISSTKDESIMSGWINAAKAVVRELILADQFDEALNVTEFAYDACDKRVFKTLRKLLFDARTAIRTERDNWKAFQLAMAALQKDSTDKHANLTVGRWQCLENDDWVTGLEHLSRGSDSELVMVAKRDLGGAATIDEQLRLADSWFDLATASEKNLGFLVRAMFWYQQSQDDVAGLMEKKVSVRLTEANKKLDQFLDNLVSKFAIRFREKLKLTVPLIDLDPVVYSAFADHTYRGSQGVLIDGHRQTNSFQMHPPQQGAARAVFELKNAYREASGIVVIAETATKDTETPLTFIVLGDGRELWRSLPTTKRGSKQPFHIELSNVNSLELRVECPGVPHYAHAGWVDVELLKAGTPRAPTSDHAKSRLAETVRETTNTIGTDGEKAGEERSDNGLKMKLCWCPKGTFKMGDDKVDVTLTRGFWMGKYEVTQLEYQSVMGKNPSMFKGDEAPVERVDWNEAAEFCQKMTTIEKRAGRLRSGWEYRLPTETQWEYACRAGTTTVYSFGDHEEQLGDYAWYDRNSIGKTHPVGGKKPNTWGLHDVHGNVCEWCRDVFPSRIRSGSDSIRVLRGGSWQDPAASCRATYYIRDLLVLQFSDLGFRVALVPSNK